MNVIKNITLEYNMSQVKSQISDKIYETTIDDLYEFDVDAEVDLYKINVFNKNIMIAPGKVINDAKKGIYYSYVYVIKDGQVFAKLGIYETNIKSKVDIFDLSEFDSSLLLFDIYYNEPARLVEFEMEEADNIFDYLKQFLNVPNNATAAIKLQNGLISKMIIEIKTSVENKTILKSFKINHLYDDAFLDTLKEKEMTPDETMFVLFILEQIFRIKFKFIDEDSGESINDSELRRLYKTKVVEPEHTIIVSLGDTPKFVKEETENVDEDVDQVTEMQVKPVIDVAVEPVSAKPVSAKPVSAKPVSATPVLEKLATATPVLEKLATATPVLEKLATAKPVIAVEEFEDLGLKSDEEPIVDSVTKPAEKLLEVEEKANVKPSAPEKKSAKGSLKGSKESKINFGKTQPLKLKPSIAHAEPKSEPKLLAVNDSKKKSSKSSKMGSLPPDVPVNKIPKEVTFLGRKS